MQAPPLISRSAWQAAPFKGSVQSLGVPDRVVVHHAAGYRAATLAEGKQQVKAIQKSHQKKWSDIGYHFLIDAAGNLYQGRPFFQGTALQDTPRLAMGAHVLAQNSRKVGVCLLGCFHPQLSGCNDVPTAAALATLQQTLRFLTQAYGVPIASIKTHRDFLATDCPGDTLYAQVQDIKDQLAAAHT